LISNHVVPLRKQGQMGTDKTKVPGEAGNDGDIPTTSHWREDRRMLAWELRQRGWSQRRIAAALGVSQGVVSQWLQRARSGGGAEALRNHPARGRPAALTEEQLHEIPALIARGAEAFGFQGEEWTTARVAAALQQRFGVHYHPAHISRILRQHCPDWRNRMSRTTREADEADHEHAQ
jgi:transposase